MAEYSPSASMLSTSKEQARRLARGEVTVTRLLVKGFLRSPGKAFVWLVGGGFIAAVVGNMLLQPERHVYPMFAGNPVIHAEPQPSSAPVPVSRGAERAVEAPRASDLLRDIQSELSLRGFFSGTPDGLMSPRTTQAIRDFQAASGMPVTGVANEPLLASILISNVKPRDQIAQTLRASVDRLERAETVLAVQRALNRLGYGPLKEDGQMGQGTRAALDRFERERKLPARGDNPNRTLRELSTAAGIAIN